MYYRKEVFIVKELLFPLILTVVCWLMNPIAGVAASAIFLLYAFAKFLPNILALKGNKRYSSGDTEGALKYYKKAVGTGRASDKIKLYYALMLLRSGRPDEAEQAFDKIILRQSADKADKIAARQYRCMAYCKQGRIDEALEDANELFDDARNSTTYSLVGYLMHLTNTNLADLLSLCKEGYEYNPDARDIADNYLLALIKSGDYTAAKEVGNKLIDDNPTFIEAYYHMALCEKALGNKKAATELLSHIPECNRTYLTTVSEEEVDALLKEVS